MAEAAQPSPKALRRKLNFSRELEQQHGWYHSIELPDGSVIEGVHSVERLRKRYAEFPIPDDLAGKRALDVGAWDGWFSFEMERHGAEVVAVDCVEIPNFVYAHKRLGSKVDYRILDVYELTPATVGYFDIVLFLGVLYHLKHPLLSLEMMCALTKDVCVVDSFVVRLPGDLEPDPERIPYMEFYETDELGEQLDNWNGPTLDCLMALCRAAGFARVQLLRVDSQRGVVACFRKWEPEPAAPSFEPPVLNCAVHSRNWGINFKTGADEYFTCWFRSAEDNLTRENILPEVGGYGVYPIHVKRLDDGMWQVNFRVPPGLAPGWHEVRVRTANSRFSNPTRIAIDLPLKTEGLTLAAVCDGTTWERGAVALTDRSFISFWLKGLPENCDRNNVRVYLADVRLPVDFIAEPDVNRFRQINVVVPASVPKGGQEFVVKFGEAVSERVPITVK